MLISFALKLKQPPSRFWNRSLWRNSRSGRSPLPWIASPSENRKWSKCDISFKANASLKLRWFFFPLRKTYLLVWLVTVMPVYGMVDPQDLSRMVFPFPSTIWDFNAQQRSLNNNEHWCQCQYWSESTMMEYHQIVPSASIGVLKAECSKGHLDGLPRSHADVVGLVL